MPRRLRGSMGGMVCHVLNRGCGKMRIFSSDADYAAFEKLIADAMIKHPIRLLNYCLMPNHWHLTLWPTQDGDLSKFMFWLTMTHVQRWRHQRKLVGLGPLYQGRFKSFAVETDSHFLTLSRYVERNALKGGLVQKSQDWQWSSLHQRLNPKEENRPVLTEWPVERPADWLEWVNRPQTDAEVSELEQRMRSGRPFGSSSWERSTAERLGLPSIVRPRGRPRLKRP